jgi:DNA-binding response OmpR family regulator
VRILVVDDDRPVALLLADVIARDGHVVDTASDGIAPWRGSRARRTTVSGEAIDGRTRGELEAASVPILPKPFDLGRLLAGVRGMLDR